MLTQNGKTSTLTVSVPDRRDSALFSCTAVNAFGKDDTNIQVLVEGEFRMYNTIYRY